MSFISMCQTVRNTLVTRQNQAAAEETSGGSVSVQIQAALASTRISFSVTPGTGWLDTLIDNVSFLDEMLHGVVFFLSARVSRSPQCLAQNYQIKCLKFKCGVS